MEKPPSPDWLFRLMSGARKRSLVKERRRRWLSAPIPNVANFLLTRKPPPWTLPCFLMFGMPGIGKSTLLRNSGLDLRNMESAGSPIGDAFSGLSVAPEIALFDPCALLVFDREALRREHAWIRSLIDGVVIVIDSNHLLLGDATTQAELRRWQLRELLASDGISKPRRLPVWIALTKCDRIDEFSNFFAEVPEAEQTVGWVYSWQNPAVLERSHFQGRWDHLAMQFENWKSTQGTMDASARTFLVTLKSFGNLFAHSVIPLFEWEASKFRKNITPFLAACRT